MVELILAYTRYKVKIEVSFYRGPVAKWAFACKKAHFVTGPQQEIKPELTIIYKKSFLIDDTSSEAIEFIFYSKRKIKYWILNEIFTINNRKKHRKELFL